MSSKCIVRGFSILAFIIVLGIAFTTIGVMAKDNSTEKASEQDPVADSGCPYAKAKAESDRGCPYAKQKAVKSDCPYAKKQAEKSGCPYAKDGKAPCGKDCPCSEDGKPGCEKDCPYIKDGKGPCAKDCPRSQKTKGCSKSKQTEEI